MKRSNKPIFWSLFGAGGMLSALVGPMLVFVTGIAVPLGFLLPCETMSYDRMLAFVASGGLGVALHYRGNEAFELEMYPSRAGFELVRETLTGATPVLAPGSMSLLGLVGLVVTYRHPSRPAVGAAGSSMGRQS